MKLRNLFCLSILFTFLWTGPLVQASDDHDHGSAQEAGNKGGDVRDAKPFKGEIVLEKDLVKIYIYDFDKKDKDNRLVPVALDRDTLTGDVQFPKGKKQSVTLKKVGDHYEVSIPGISKTHRYDLHVNIEAGGKKAKADFGIDNI